MLVGTELITISEVKSHCSSYKALLNYTLSKIPKHFRGVKEIVDNQKYLVALYVRKAYKDDYNKWHPLCSQLLEGVRVHGCVDTLTSCTEVLEECDLKMLKKFL